MTETLLAGATVVALFFPTTTDNAEKIQNQVIPSVSLNSDARELTYREQRILFRICSREDTDNQERCVQRQLARFGLDNDRVNPINAYDVYDGLDIGYARLRRQLQEKRLADMNARIATRTTFRQNPNQQNTEHQVVDYVDEIRQERLRCMLMTSNRAKSLCLDELAQNARDKAKDRLTDLRDVTRGSGSTTTAQ